MLGMTTTAVLLFAGSVIFQLIALYLMPMTKGLTSPGYTALWAVTFLIGVGLLARLVHSGVNLSTALPLMAAIVPLCTIAIGVLAYGEAASLLKIGLLVGACALIGIASAS